jgi:hypothetical protein
MGIAAGDVGVSGVFVEVALRFVEDTSSGCPALIASMKAAPPRYGLWNHRD